MKYVLIGNYGVGNLGDEALKDYFVKYFPDMQWQVVSANPDKNEFHRLPCGIRSLFAPWWQTVRVIRQSEGVVFGGGSLFTDTESLYACFLWWWHVFISHLLGKKVILAFQGIGPFRTWVGKWFARSSCKMASHISVRDSISMDRVKSWSLNTEVVQTFDPVFSLFNKVNTDLSSQNVFIILPRKNSSVTFLNRAQELLRIHTYDEVRILSMQPDDLQEQKLCMQLASYTKNPTVVPVRLLSELAAHMFVGSFILTQRYHGALAAIALSKDCEIIPQKEGDKLSQLKNMQEQPDQCRELVQAGEDVLREWMNI